MKKKVLTVLLTAVMAISMTACGGDKEKTEGGSADKESAKGVKTIEIDLTNEVRRGYRSLKPRSDRKSVV